MIEVCCLAKKYHFTAGHRLYFKNVSDQENFKIFGKCSNPRGHGHDYYLEVKVRGNIDRITGKIVNLDYLDTIVVYILQELNYKRLDKEIEHFTEIQPTGENIVTYLWTKINNDLRDDTRVVYLKLLETDNNFFEYFEVCDYEYEN